MASSANGADDVVPWSGPSLLAGIRQRSEQMRGELDCPSIRNSRAAKDDASQLTAVMALTSDEAVFGAVAPTRKFAVCPAPQTPIETRAGLRSTAATSTSK